MIQWASLNNARPAERSMYVKFNEARPEVNEGTSYKANFERTATLSEERSMVGSLPSPSLPPEVDLSPAQDPSIIQIIHQVRLVCLHPIGQIV